MAYYKREGDDEPGDSSIDIFGVGQDLFQYFCPYFNQTFTRPIYLKNYSQNH